MKTLSPRWTLRIGTLIGLSPALMATALLVMVAGMGFSVILPFLPLYAVKLGANNGQLGWMVSSFAVASALAAALGGHLADRFDRRTVLAGGMVMFAASTLLLASAPNPTWFIAFRFLEGIGYGLVLPTGSTIAQDLTPVQQRGRILGTYATITLLGTLIGPAVGGLLAGRFGYAVLFITVATIAMMTALWALRVIPKTLPLPLSSELEQKATLRLVVTRPLFAVYIAASAVFLNNGLMQIAEVLYFRTRFGATVESIGAVFTFVAIAATLARLPGGILVDRWGPHRLLVLGLLLSGLATAAIVAFSTFSMAIGMSALGAFFGVLAFSAIPVMIADHVASPLRGRANGIIGVLSSAGLIVGAPIGTALYGQQMALPFLLAGTVFVGCAFVVMLSLRYSTDRDNRIGKPN